MKEGLEKFLQDRLVENIENFSKGEKAKRSGVSSGSIREKDGHQYMFKNASLAIIDEKDSVTLERKLQEKSDLVTEFVLGPLYKRVLFDGAPAIGLTSPPSSSENKDINLKSKFLENFETLSRHHLTRMNQEIEIKNFEKIIAGSLFLGEIDFHHENLGVIINDNPNENFVAKVDHGRSATKFAKNSEDLLDNYYLAKNSLNIEMIKFDIAKFGDALSSIAQTQDIEEIRNLISGRIDLLKKNGFQPETYFQNIKIGEKTETKDILSKREIDSRFKKIEDYLVDSIAKQIEIFKEAAQDIEIIKKFDHLKYLDETKFQRLYKMVCNDKIAGLVEFAMQENTTLDNGLSPIEFALKNSVKKINNLDIYEFAMRTDFQIEQKNPLLYTIEKQKANPEKWKQEHPDFSDPLKYSLENDLLINGTNIKNFAYKNNWLNGEYLCFKEDNDKKIISEIEDGYQELVESMVKDNIINYKLENGRTILGLAVENQNRELVNLLLAAGEDISLLDNEQKKASSYSPNNDFKTELEFLEKLHHDKESDKTLTNEIKWIVQTSPYEENAKEKINQSINAATFESENAYKSFTHAIMQRISELYQERDLNPPEESFNNRKEMDKKVTIMLENLSQEILPTKKKEIRIDPKLAEGAKFIGESAAPNSPSSVAGLSPTNNRERLI